MTVDEDRFFTRFMTPLGEMAARGGDKGVTRIYLPGSAPLWESTEFPWPLEKELGEYFAGTRQAFSLPIDLTASPFTLRVLFACREIPYGRTATYGQLALWAGAPGAARAVGTAMSRNPLPILIPCHRVLPASGGVGSYGGGPEGAALKAALLAAEGIRLP